MWATPRRIVLAIALAATGCGGERPREPEPVDPRVIARVVAYFERTTEPSGIAFRVTSLEPSEVPGWRRGRLHAILGTQQQDLEFHVSADGRWLVRGEVADLTVDPLKAVMDRIALGGQPSRGSADARVTIVEYSDFQCPYCIRVSETVDEILRKYGDRVRFVYKNLPLGRFHLWAEPAAIAAECAFRQGDRHFWTLYDAFFAARGSIDHTNLEAKVLEIGAADGMDTRRLAACLDGKETQAAVQADVDEATALGITSTPAFVVNGRRLVGAQDASTFEQVIDEELGPGG